MNLNGYRIPKNAHVVPLLHTVHMDPNLWESPEEFKPCRFLSPEGKVTKPEFFMPFGVGRRMCLGDVLARMELFLFFSSILHINNVSVPEGQSLPSLKGNAGITVTPDSFKVRNHSLTLFSSVTDVMFRQSFLVLIFVSQVPSLQIV